MGTLYVGQERIDPGLTRGVEIIDSLDSHEEDSALSREKGEELAANKLDHLSSGNGMTVSNGMISANLDEDTVYTDGTNMRVKVVDHLNATSGTGALSARQGLVINESMFERISRYYKTTLPNLFNKLCGLRPGDYINGDISHFDDGADSIMFEGIFIKSERTSTSNIVCYFAPISGTTLVRGGSHAGRFPISPTELVKLTLYTSTSPSVCTITLNAHYLYYGGWDVDSTRGQYNVIEHEISYTQQQLIDNDRLFSNFTITEHSQVPGETR